MLFTLQDTALRRRNKKSGKRSKTRHSRLMSVSSNKPNTSTAHKGQGQGQGETETKEGEGGTVSGSKLNNIGGGSGERAQGKERTLRGCSTIGSRKQQLQIGQLDLSTVEQFHVVYLLRQKMRARQFKLDHKWRNVTWAILGIWTVFCLVCDAFCVLFLSFFLSLSIVLLCLCVFEF